MVARGKRGMEMTISTIIIIILSLFVLAGMLFMFTAAGKNFRQIIGNYFAVSNVDSIVSGCNNLALQGASFEYCCVNKTVTISSNEQYTMSCAAVAAEVWGSRINALECAGVC